MERLSDGIEAVRGEAGSGVLEPDRWRLKLERLWLRERPGRVGELRVGPISLFGLGVDILRDPRAEGGGRHRPRVARRVRGGLRAQLGEVEIAASPVAEIHGLAKPPLGPIAVEDDAVDDDGDDLDHDLDDAAEERPILDEHQRPSPTLPGRGSGGSRLTWSRQISA